MIAEGSGTQTALPTYRLMDQSRQYVEVQRAIDARRRKNVDDCATVRVGNIGEYSRNTDVKEDSSSHKGERITVTWGKSS
jgi:hypothetical protein